MPWTNKHLEWLKDTGERLTTVDGKTVEIWEFQHQKDDNIFSAWAKHFRNHYCNDSEIDALRAGTGLSQSEYLLNYIFPDVTVPPGPSIRAGDFGEILVADYLEYLLKYWVPRFRYDEKAIRNESTKGVDILGFQLVSKVDSTDDTLAVFEVKAKLTGEAENKLQNAVEDSAKDFYIRKAESLNFLKRRFIKSMEIEKAKTIQRFQNKADNPYRELSGAAAIYSINTFDARLIASTDTSSHPNNTSLILLVIKGHDLMKLAHEIYRRAADEA